MGFTSTLSSQTSSNHRHHLVVYLFDRQDKLAAKDFALREWAHTLA